MHVVHDEVLFAGLLDVDDLNRGAAAKPDPLFVVRAEADRLLVLETDLVLGFVLLAGDEVERTVVEDVAVLVDLDERRAAVRGGRFQDARQMLPIDVQRARDEGGLGSERQRDGVEGPVERAERRRLRHFADLRRRGVLGLGQPVDPVVEQKDLQVDVAAQRVDQVVAADRQRVAVTRRDPHREIRARHREPGRDRRRAPVDRVHAVRVHVVGEAA